MTSKEIVTSLRRYVKDRIPKYEKIYEWAAYSIFLQGGVFTAKGWFDVNRSNYMRDIFDAIQNPEVEVVVIYKPVQTGGSLIADIASLWWLCKKRTPVMYATARDELAKTHMNTRLRHLLKACPELKVLLDNPKKITENGVDELNYFVYPATEGNLQGRPISLLVCDETWKWNSEVDLQWAMARVDAFRTVNNSKVIVVSQPGQADDQTDAIYNKGTRKEWAVPCMKCGGYSIPTWSDIKYDKFYVGNEFDYAKIYESIKYDCPLCGFEHEDTNELKNAWNLRGKYIQTNPNPEPKVESFTYTAIPIKPWTYLLGKWLTAVEENERGDKQGIITFNQQQMAKPETGITEKEFLYVATGSLENEWGRIAAIDYQGQIGNNHFWLEIRSVSKDGKLWQLYFDKLLTEDDVKAKLLEFSVNPKLTFIDIGHLAEEKVFAMIVKNGWCGLKGHGCDGFSRVGKNKRITYKYFSKLRSNQVFIDGRMRNAHWLMWSTEKIRDIVYRLRNDNTGRFVSLDNETYKKQLWGEVRYRNQDPKTGKWSTIWTKKRGSAQNHGFDTTCMIVAACYITQQVGMMESADYIATNPVEE